MEEAPASVPFYPFPSFAPTRGRIAAAGAWRRRRRATAGRRRATHACHRRPLAAPATAAVAGSDEEGGAATPHAVLVRPAQGPCVQVMPGALGCAALVLPAPRGTPSIGARGGRCGKCTLIGMGSLCPPLRGGAATTTMGRGGPGKGRATERWRGRGGGHLTVGAQSYRRAAVPRVGEGWVGLGWTLPT